MVLASAQEVTGPSLTDSAVLTVVEWKGVQTLHSGNASIDR
jgi:hypothetical protein